MRRLYQQIADQIRLAIENGAYVVGERLPAERVLAEQLNVSRPTIREAIIALEIAGLVEVRMGSGVYLLRRSSDRKDAGEPHVGPFELLEARRGIESECAALAATRIDDVQLARLDRLLLDMAHENDIGAIGEQADREFHMVIAESTQNSIYTSTINKMWRLRETSPMLVSLLNRARAYGVQPMIEDHQAIVEALRLHDPDRAHKAMHDHLSRVMEALLESTEAEAVEKARNEAKRLRDQYQRAR